MLTIGTSLESSRRAVALAEQYSQVWAVIGIHPNAAAEAGQDDLKELRELARSPRVAAIGETGLDYLLPSAWPAQGEHGGHQNAAAGGNLPGRRSLRAISTRWNWG